MSAADTASRDAGAWFVEADHVSVTALARRRSRARMDEERAKSGRVVIVSSLFLVLFTAALLIGGHAAIDPLLQSAVDARETKGTGEVVWTMPDGIFCRHMSFDNVTAEITEGGIERCTKRHCRKSPARSPGFCLGTPIEPAVVGRPVARLLRLDHRRRVRYFRSGMRALLKTGIRQMRTTFFVCRLALPVCALLFCSLHQAGAQGRHDPRRRPTGLHARRHATVHRHHPGQWRKPPPA